MAKIIGSVETRGKKYKIRHTRKIILLILAIITIILAILTLYYAYIQNNRLFGGYDILKAEERQDESGTAYLPYGYNYIKYNRDGIYAMEQMGNVIWNNAYEMKNPKVTTNGSYVLITDMGYKQFCVVDKKGSMKTIQVAMPILEATLSRQGEVVVMLQDEDSYVFEYYDAYDSQEQMKAIATTYISQDGYPVALCLSEDGTKLVTSYLNHSGENLISNVTFYNFGGVGEEASTDRIVGAKVFEGVIVPKVQFIGNDTVGVFSETSVTLFSMKQKPKELKIIEFEKEIVSVVTSDANWGVVVQEDETNQSFYLYDTNGEKVCEIDQVMEYNSIELHDKEIIFLGDLEAKIYRTSGKLKFDHIFDQNIDAILPISLRNKYVVVMQNQLIEIKLTEG